MYEPCDFYINGQKLNKTQFLNYVKGLDTTELNKVLGDIPTYKQVPKAPFITDTNSWVKLGLRTALKEAIKQGVDRIAWTTGEQQNERYNLSNYVDRIEYTPNEDGTYNVNIYEKNNTSERLWGKRDATIKELEDTIGKDATQKIVDDVGDNTKLAVSTQDRDKGNFIRELRDDNLKVGGKGMIGFYGSPQESKLGIVGNIAKSLFKQEPKVTKIASDVDAIEKYEIYRDEGTYKLKYRLNGGFEGREAFSSKAEAENRLKELNDKYSNKQHSIDITPQLKAEVEKGLPLFQKGKGKPKGAVETLADGKVIIHALTRPDFSTMVHEIIHVFEKDLSGDEITTIEKWSGKKQGTREFSEAFARGGERYLRDGKSPAKELTPIFEKFKQWLTDIYKTLKGSPIEKKLSPQVRKIFDRLLTEQSIPVEPLSPTEGITAPPKVESVAKEDPQGKGEQKRAGFEKRETAKGTRGSIELREDEIGKVVKGIIDKNPHFYTESHRAGAVEAAKAYIIDNGIDNAYADLVAKTKDLEKLPIRHVARQVLMQYYGGKLVELNKQNDKRGANSIADKIIELEDRTQKEVRIAGTTSAFTMWSFLDPQASVFMAEKLVKEVNKQKLGFEDEAAQDFLEKWNEEVPTMVKQLLTENKEFKDTIEKLESRIKRLEDKKPTTVRVTKEKAKEIADKIRSLKPSTWGLTFADPVGAVAILEGALELTAKTVEVTGNVIQAINDGIRYIKNTDWYKGLSTDHKKAVEKKYRDEVKADFDFEAEEYVKGTSWYRRESEGLTEPTKEQQAKKEYAKTKKESDERLRDQIYDIIAAHWLVEKEGGAELADKLQEELGLTKSEAKKIADIAISTFEAGAQKVFDKTLAPKLPNKAKKKLAFDKFFGLIKRGVLNDSNYADLFAEKYKLRKGLTPDEKRELLRLGLNAEKLAPMGYFGDLAMNEFMQYMAKLTDMDNWATRQTKLMIAANYARMLSGLTTHWINLSSSGVNIAARPLLTLNNWERWFDAAYAYSTGNKMKARLINPMAELYYMYPSYVAGTKIGFNQAMNIVKHGNIKEASKYMESVGNKRGLNVPVLEKSTYGKGKAFIPLGTQKFDVNIFNKMKYSGRALMAEDMQMFNVPFSLALAMAARSKAIREGTTLSEKELRKKIIGEIQGTFLTEKQVKDVESQLEQELEALADANIEVDAGQIKQRRFEIVRSLLNLEPEVVEEATQSARSEIFTGERGGIFSKLSDVASRLFNMNVVVKVAGLPHVPFTTVVGRIADYSLDGIPGYGNLRAIGASPTGIIARARYFHKTGNWRDFFESPAAIGEFKSAQMGSIGSPAYYQQTNRAYMGMMLMTVGAALFLGDDPEDGSEPRWDITGALSYADMDKKQWHPMGAYTIKIPVPGSKKGIHIRYLNFPLVNFMLGTLGNYKDHVRAGKDDEELPAKLGLALHSMFHSLGMIKDTSLAQGISDFIKLIGNGLSAIGSGDEKEILREEDLIERTPENKALIKSLTDMRDDYLQVPLRYVDPLKSNLIQQIWKGITPEGRLKGTSWQLLYYNLGIQNITNDKRTDIFGQEVKVMPGDQGIAWPRPNDSRWKKIWDYNIDLTDITPHDRKNVDGVNRTFEWDEYIERKAKANQLFKKRFDEYFEKLKPEEIEEKRKTFHIEKPSARKRNELDKELNDIWKKTKEDVDKVVFDWREHYKKEPVIFNKLMERSLVPDFYNERQEVDGRKILVPFDLLEKMNKEAMDAFLVSLKPQEKNDDYWKSGSELEKSINRKWDSAIENPKKKMIDDLQKRYGKKAKGKL